MDHTTATFRHLTPVQLRFSDTDLIGHINNSVYQSFFDVARLSYFREVMGEEPDWKNFAFFLASIRIDYFSPVLLSEKVAVRSRTEMIGDKSITMVQELFNSETGEIKAFNRSTLVGFSVPENKTESVPDSWKKNIAGYEVNILYKYPLESN